MTRRKVWALTVAWAVSLIGVGVWAQGTSFRVTKTDVQPGDPIGQVIESPNIGFQRIVTSQRDRTGTVSGHLMVRVDGEWLIATAPMTMRPMAAN